MEEKVPFQHDPQEELTVMAAGRQPHPGDRER